MTERRPGRGSDQFPLRLPDGMRDEIKRLAQEDGRSMNAQIIELLTFALKNSGLDLDEIFRMLANQSREIANARKGDELQRIMARYETLLDQQKALLNSVCLHVINYGDQVPAGLKDFAWEIMSLADIDKPRPDDAPVDDPTMAR